MTRPLLAMFACYALGLVAGQKPASYENVAVVSCAPAPTITVADTEPVVEPTQTPLVEKLLPKSEPPKPAIADGQRTSDGFFWFDTDRNAWIPVDHGHVRYTENGHTTTAAHLIREHGHARSSVEKWTQAEIEIAHANSHWWEKTHNRPAPPLPLNSGTRSLGGFSYSSSCPNGRCPRR